MRHAALTVAAAILAVFVGCGGGELSREDVLADLADEAIVPAIEQLSIETDELAAATTALCTNLSPDALGDARDALVDARAVWSYSEPMWVGPVMERRSWALIDWPIVTDEIEELVADTSIELDNERLSRRIGADQRGFGAVEYILGDTADEAAVLDQLSDPRRCQYLTGITTVIADEAALLPSGWTVDFEEGGPYRTTFASIKDSGLDAIVNDALFLLEAMADAELGTALGEMDRDADLDAIVEGPAGLAVSDLIRHLAGLRIVLVGDDETAGLSSLLGDDLTGRLTTQFDEAKAAVAALEPPLRAAVTGTPESVAAARDAIKAIQVTVATEVVSRLGVTIGFSDADGDTGS